MIYHVALSSPMRVVVIEAGSFYVDQGAYVFRSAASGSINDFDGGSSNAVASFPASSVLWVIAENTVLSSTAYPRMDLAAIPEVDSEARAAARELLRHAPAIIPADPNAIPPSIRAGTERQVDQARIQPTLARPTVSPYVEGTDRRAFESIGASMPETMPPPHRYNAHDGQSLNGSQTLWIN